MKKGLWAYFFQVEEPRPVLEPARKRGRVQCTPPRLHARGPAAEVYGRPRPRPQLRAAAALRARRRGRLGRACLARPAGGVGAPTPQCVRRGGPTPVSLAGFS